MKDTSLPGIKIGALRKYQLRAAAGLADAELGKGFLSRRQMEGLMAEREKYTFLVARDHKDVVGFCYVSRLDNMEVNTHNSRMGLPAPAAAAVGMLRSVAIHDGHKGKGIGTELLRRAFGFLYDEGIRTYYVIGWEKDHKVNIQGVLLRLGFHQHARIDDYWYQDSLHHRYTCAGCGAPPCTCPGVVFVKHC